MGVKPFLEKIRDQWTQLEQPPLSTYELRPGLIGCGVCGIDALLVLKFSALVCIIYSDVLKKILLKHWVEP